MPSFAWSSRWSARNYDCDHRGVTRNAHCRDEWGTRARFNCRTVSVGVGVAVVVFVGGDGFERGWGGAAVGGLAAANLKLDGGVGDVEAVAQGAVDGVEDAAALGERHLRDGDVAGQRVGG